MVAKKKPTQAAPYKQGVLIGFIVAMLYSCLGMS